MNKDIKDVRIDIVVNLFRLLEKYTGRFVCATLLFYLASRIWPWLFGLDTLFTWLVVILLWPKFSAATKRQTLLLVGAGALLLGIVIWFRGWQGWPGWQQVFGCNVPLLAMFAAVSFLSLTTPQEEDPHLPAGRKAAATTAVGTHFIGAVINLSVIFVFGDRMKKGGTLSRDQMVLLARSFAAAGWWSPFFIATGVALTYLPDMEVHRTMLPGAVMALAALGYTVTEVCFVSRTPFSGYPIKMESLTVPLTLAGLVIIGHRLVPEVSILLLICILAPLGGFVFMKNRPRLHSLGVFIDRGILSVGSQFALFLGAGFFSAGIRALILAFPAQFNLEGMSFSPLVFAVVLAMMILVSLFGVHPVVSVAILAPMLLPVCDDHSQLGFLFLSGWAIGTGCSPLSGIGLAMSGRYNFSPKAIIGAHFHYALLMWLGACLVNWLYFSQVFIAH